MNIVISQSMLFPWVGMLEQINLADCFVHYDDVQFSKGSFVNRVQIKTPQGMRWMTVPLKNRRLGQNINEVEIVSLSNWKENHLKLLNASFEGAKYANDVLELVHHVYSISYSNIADLSRASLMSLVEYFGLGKSTSFLDINDLNIKGSSNIRVLNVVKKLEGKNYITGLGGLNYLDHNLFEANGINVSYMKYRCVKYPQLHGKFTPYVSGLDLIANCGKDGIKYICSKTIDWRSLVNEPC